MSFATLFGFDPQANRRLAHAARLHDTELEDMCGSALLPSYAGSQYAEFITARRTRGNVSEPWFFHTSSRYCPECLSGDGSPIQHKLGGPWKLRWRLPVTVAYVPHRRTLSHRCPKCSGIAPGLSDKSYWTLAPQPATADVHPTRCRVCTAALTVSTKADRLSPSELDRAVALQNLFNRILEAPHAAARAMGQQIPPPIYFVDLHIITTYLQATWKGSKHPHDECAEGYDAWHGQGSPAKEKTALRRSTSPWPPAPHDLPPLDAAACALLMLMATDILHSPSPREAGAAASVVDQASDRGELGLDSPMFRTMRRGSASPLYKMLNSPAAQAKNHVFLDALHPRIERLADSIAAAIDTGLMV